MKKVFSLLIVISAVTQVHALLISEVMSNPTGDDSGREWIEVYNDTESSVDISALTISIKGATAIVATPVAGGTSLAPGAYAIIGSTVSGATKFTQDYPSYSGVLLRSAIGLVNTGVTSIDIKLSGATVDSLSSYTAAKEGFTLSLVNGSFVQSNPTPGVLNEASVSDSSSSNSNTSTTTNSQVTIARQSAPSPDIILYMPFEKTVVAGAESVFSTYGMTHGGSEIDGLVCNWAFGDGGQGAGTSTTYRYVYPGRYIAQVEASNGIVSGVGLMKVRVVPPDISISKVETGKYGAYVDIFNPNNYELDLSQWKLSFNGVTYPFPKNTLVLGGETTRFSGIAMGFASTTVASTTVVKILFPNLEDVTVYIPKVDSGIVAGTSTVNLSQKPQSKPASYIPRKAPSASPLLATSSTSTVRNSSAKVKDTRIISWFRSFFGK